MKESMICECGGKMTLEKISIAPEVGNEGYKCEKCNNVEFTEEQMRKVLRKKETDVKTIPSSKAMKLLEDDIELLKRLAKK
jgi:hypothetical protein